MTVWNAPLDDPRLDADQVHVWRACLDQAQDQVEAFGQTLSADERARAARLRAKEQQCRFTTARGTLRALAGGYLSCDPELVQIQTDERGKPCLADGALSLNLSHAGSMGLFAFALKRRIGVDVESASRRVAGDRIAERFLAESEASGLRSVSKPHRHRAFLRYWTHKEAYLKATGEGISSGSLSRFEVSVDPQLPARLERVDGAPDEAGRWRLEDLPLDGSTFVGAVCVEGQDWRLRCLQFVQS